MARTTLWIFKIFKQKKSAWSHIYLEYVCFVKKHIIYIHYSTSLNKNFLQVQVSQRRFSFQMFALPIPNRIFKISTSTIFSLLKLSDVGNVKLYSFRYRNNITMTMMKYIQSFYLCVFVLKSSFFLGKALSL